MHSMEGPLIHARIGACCLIYPELEITRNKVNT
jgi:hypothetical protein